MRFEPEHDPDPLRSKFKTIDSLDDLPADRTELMNDLKDKISEMLTIHEKNHPEDNSLVAYTAFQELQIHTLQHEIKNMYEVLMSMAAALDELKG
jgi:two-component sensor histidine kinase